MAKPEKPSKPGFIIKLSNETALKLAEEEQQTKLKAEVDVHLQETTAEGTNKKPNTKSLKKSKQSVLEVKTSSEKTKVDNQSSASEAKPKPHDSAKDIPDANSQSTETTSALWGEYAAYTTYEGDDAIYTDPSSKQRYKWNKDTNSWDTTDSAASERVYSYEDDTHIYTEPDGSKFFYDEAKKAWIPKIDDDFLAFYQMSYGFVDNKPKEPVKKEEKPKEEKKQPEIDPTTGVKRKAEPQWFDASDETNTKVYVSNLPLDLTEEEFVTFMQKCGLVERDPSMQKMKVKLYMDKEQNCFKGDALCTYIKVESVELALKLLDGSDFKGNTIKVERAHFQLKGAYNPALKPKKKKKKELDKLKKIQQKLFDWRPEKFIGERSKHERVVIIKNLFHPTDFDKEVQLILDYQQDLREEATKCGEVRKVVIYDRHPEGVAQITMKEPEQADAVVTLMTGRWFGKRQITAEIWDGRTKYRIAETDADINKRIDKWDKFLEGKEEGKSTETKANISGSSEMGTKVTESAEKETKVTKSTETRVRESTETETKVRESTETETKVRESTEIETKPASDSGIEPEGATVSIEHKNVGDQIADEKMGDDT